MLRVWPGLFRTPQTAWIGLELAYVLIAETRRGTLIGLDVDNRAVAPIGSGSWLERVFFARLPKAEGCAAALLLLHPAQDVCDRSAAEVKA